MGKNLWPFIPYTVIPALHGDTSHHRGVNAGIQGFEVNDWMPVPTFVRTGFTTAGMTDNGRGAFGFVSRRSCNDCQLKYRFLQMKKEGDENPSVRIFLLTRESRVDSSPWVDLSPSVVIFLEQIGRDPAYTRR